MLLKTKGIYWYELAINQWQDIVISDATVHLIDQEYSVRESSVCHRSKHNSLNSSEVSLLGLGSDRVWEQDLKVVLRRVVSCLWLKSPSVIFELIWIHTSSCCFELGSIVLFFERATESSQEYHWLTVTIFLCSSREMLTETLLICDILFSNCRFLFTSLKTIRFDLSSRRLQESRCLSSRRRPPPF